MPRTHTSSKPGKQGKRPRRDLAQEFTDALRRLDIPVVTAKDLAAYTARTSPHLLVVTEFTPKPIDSRTGKARRWALDFCVPQARVFVEIDGFYGYRPVEDEAGNVVGEKRTVSGHRNWGGFHRDRSKDRTLTLNGWRGLRFGPGDMKSARDVDTCVQEFLTLVYGVLDGTIR